MHEMAVAQSLVELIAQEAESRHAKPIRAKMSCGELNAINDEALTFAFEAIAAGTLCEGTKLEVEHKPLQAKCKTCDRTFAVDFADAKCPDCGGDDFDLLPDAPLLVEQIEFEGLDDGES
jgi:hydrogenase nickel incorporation protein HypA/HybF